MCAGSGWRRRHYSTSLSRAGRAQKKKMTLASRAYLKIRCWKRVFARFGRRGAVSPALLALGCGLWPG